MTTRVTIDVADDDTARFMVTDLFTDMIAEGQLRVLAVVGDIDGQQDRFRLMSEMVRSQKIPVRAGPAPELEPVG